MCIAVQSEKAKFDTAVSLVESWNFGRVKQILVEEKGLDPAYVDSLESEYRRYLVTVAVLRKPFIMSGPVDVFGHTHALMTRDYRNMCAALLDGGFIHHEPTVGQEERDALLPEYRDTIGRMTMLFGQSPSPIFWPATDCVCRWNPNDD